MVVVIDVSCPSQMKLIEQKPVERVCFSDSRERFAAIPLFPIDGIDIKERIRLSIDLYYEIFINEYVDYRASIVDIDGDRISFFHVSEEGIERYDVTDWDDENVYCKLSVERSFTILEQLLSAWFNHVFVKNGKLYVYNDHRLMVFDIRSGGRIRKLGHFMRADFRIEDITVLENGGILMSLRWDYIFGDKEIDKSYLYLLRGP